MLTNKPFLKQILRNIYNCFYSLKKKMLQLLVNYSIKIKFYVY